MLVSMPDGYLVQNLIYFGDSLGKDAYVSRGMRLELPDVRQADNATKILFREQSLALLASLGSDVALQLNWTLRGDYSETLSRYRQKTEEASGHPWSFAVRTEREKRHRSQMGLGALRREAVTCYVGRRVTALETTGVQHAKLATRWFQLQARQLGARLQQMAGLFPFGTHHLFEDADHAGEYLRFFNPGQRSRDVGSGGRALAERHKAGLALGHCFFGDGVPFMQPREGVCGVYFDGCYHQLFVLRDWPQQTDPETMALLTDGFPDNACITLNVYPSDIGKEIAILEEERAELMKQTDDPKKFHLHAEIERKARKIASLMGGKAQPFKVLMVIRVWDRSLHGLAEKSAAVRTAFQHWTGCRYHQVNQEAQAKNLFFETFPGWLGGSSLQWRCDAENVFLADLLPLLFTFGGNLDVPDILLEGLNGGLVGMNLFSGGTPQHACLIGMRGAGKSSVTIEMLSQTDSDCAFTGIIEEGMSYATYAQLNRFQSLILRPGAPYTWNYLDTQGLPLGPEHVASASAMLARLLGAKGDDDQSRFRLALLNEYLGILYDTLAEEWEADDLERYFGVVRQAWAIQRESRNLPEGSTWIDAYLHARDLERADKERWSEVLGTANEGELVSFSKNKVTGARVRSLIFASIPKEAFPTHGMLCSLLKSGRTQRHRGETYRREIDTMAALLGKWSAVNGLYGPLVDGVTNINLNGQGLHVELGYLGDHNRELKEVAGFLATSKMRQQVLTLPRSKKKRLVYEEVGKFLTVPGASDILAENYAQFRKYNCWVLTVFQNTEQLDRVDPSLLKTIRANSTQFWFMRHQDAQSLGAMGDPIGLPKAARTEILNYPLPEHQRTREKATFFTLYSKQGDVPQCGTVKVQVSEPLLYVATSNGATFDQRMRDLASVDDPVGAVLKRFQGPTEGSRL